LGGPRVFTERKMLTNQDLLLRTELPSRKFCPRRESLNEFLPSPSPKRRPDIKGGVCSLKRLPGIQKGGNRQRKGN